MFQRESTHVGGEDGSNGNFRAATSLARLLRDRDRIGEARDLLAPIYERFTEGFGTADLQAGKKLLDELNSPHRQ
jgi:predicted ATPase